MNPPEGLGFETELLKMSCSVTLSLPVPQALPWLWQGCVFQEGADGFPTCGGQVQGLNKLVGETWAQRETEVRTGQMEQGGPIRERAITWLF